jgi:hypothetical protein
MIFFRTYISCPVVDLTVPFGTYLGVPQCHQMAQNTPFRLVLTISSITLGYIFGMRLFLNLYVSCLPVDLLTVPFEPNLEVPQCPKQPKTQHFVGCDHFWASVPKGARPSHLITYGRPSIPPSVSTSVPPPSPLMLPYRWTDGRADRMNIHMWWLQTQTIWATGARLRFLLQFPLQTLPRCKSWCSLLLANLG